MKVIPNVISCTRIFLSLSLLMIINHKILFVIVYLICGGSDVVDGYIARKTKNETELGAKLDSIADLIMCGVILVTLYVWDKDILDRIWVYILIITGIRLINIIIIWIKFRQFAILHTYANKLTGIIFFIYPIVYITSINNIIVIILAATALFSAIEECIIDITSKKLDLNKKSLFCSQKSS